MTRDQYVAWAASLLAAVAVALLVGWLGAPTWAMVGFGLLAFYVLRVPDRRRP